MATLAYVSGHSSVSLWGLPATTRSQRLLASLKDVQQIDTLAGIDPTAKVLLLRADYLYEPRTLAALVQRPATLLVYGSDIAASCVKGCQAVAVLKALQGDGRANNDSCAGLDHVDASALQAFEGELRKAEPPLALPITRENQQALENQLYGAAYKGITDLVTKFWWPRPAKRVVHWCAERDITPNAVTFTGFVLMLAATYLFFEGQYLAGLIAGWIMTFLDTVDGKLARVTLQSSRIGGIFDHGMDILHPPFWYVYWGMSLGVSEVLGLPLASCYTLIIAGYIVGRVAEGLFDLIGGRTSLFAWRPFDAYFRLITARRNPCLILLTLGWAVGRPDLGFAAVALWTVASSAVLIVRLAQAVALRIMRGSITSWLTDPEQAQREHPRAYAVFSGTRIVDPAAKGPD